MGAAQIDDATKTLIQFKNKVDIDKSGEPAFLMVLTASELSYVREDKVYVVSIGNLKN